MGSTEEPEVALAGMQARAIFAYPTTGAATATRASRLLLNPLLGESVGWVVLEAMAMELPVVSTAVGAVPSFIRLAGEEEEDEEVEDFVRS
eukprot:756965-Hanusia_phi.AAC.2